MKYSYYRPRIELALITLILIAALAWFVIKHVWPFLHKKVETITHSHYTQPVLQATQEQTLAIIKPDAVNALHTGDIIKIIELNKFIIKDMLKTQLSTKQAEDFYKIHKDKPFYAELVNYMTSGPVIIMALEKVNAVQEWRELMGATNPVKAAPGTIRKMFGSSITQNAAHGSDAVETARQEIGFFFKS